MTCPSCEYNKQRAAIWRAEAYKQAGHDVIQRPWVELTPEEVVECQQGNIYHFYRCIDAKLKEKNT